jgi:hypothetical protein
VIDRPRRESDRAILAHVKELMDEPRMSESTREQEQGGQAEQSAAKRFGVELNEAA